MTSMRGRIEQLLKIAPGSKPGVYLEVFNSSEVVSLNYGLELLFSAGIATLGLVLNSPAVVIGAMLISPLMGPILAAGLALAAADLYLGIKSLLSILVGVAASLLFSATLVWLLPFQTATGEIVARTQPNLLDLGVALLSGLAGSVVVCRRSESGGVTALPGVAIAVALMPPLCTVGFGMGSGFDWAIISGAGLLFLTNLAAIVASAFLVFYVVRMDSPDVRTKIDSLVLEGASHDRLYAVLQRTRLSEAFGHVGKLRWRIVMLVAILAILFVPLRRSLLQVRDEASSRAAVREALRLLGPADYLCYPAGGYHTGPDCNPRLRFRAGSQEPDRRSRTVFATAHRQGGQPDRPEGGERGGTGTPAAADENAGSGSAATAGPGIDPGGGGRPAGASPERNLAGGGGGTAGIRNGFFAGGRAGADPVPVYEGAGRDRTGDSDQRSEGAA